jgi:hypothetical protein
MGPGDTLTFYRGLLDSYRDSSWVVSNYNSQHFPHILLRLSGVLGVAARPYLPVLSMFSFSLAALSLVFIYRVQRARLPHANLWSIHLLFLSIPFFLKTSWPVDLVYISFAQAFLAWQIIEGEPPRSAAPRKRLTSGIVLAFLVLSIGLSNMVTFYLISNHRVYGFLGFIFWADLLCLITSYVLLLPLVLPSHKT